MSKISLLQTRRLRTFTYGSIVVSALFLLAFFLVPSVQPGASYAEPGIDTTPSLSITTGSTLDIAVEPGSFASGSQTLHVSTSNYTGYTLSIATDGTSTDLVGTNNKTIPTITLPNGSSSITSSQFTTASYGYSTDGTNYKPAPATNTDGAVIASTTKDDPKTNDHNLTFGVKTESTTPGGLYTKTFTLTATANTPAYYITYDANGGTGTMSNTHANVVVGSSVQLVPPSFTKSNAAFIGWSLNKNATVGTYGPQQKITITQSILDSADPVDGSHITLYAIWKTSEGNLQSFTTANCASMSTGDVKALTDSRDSKVYSIAKLDDGRCWMTENLRFNFATNGNSLSASNTNNPTSSFVTAAQAKPAQTNSLTTYDAIKYNTGNISGTSTPDGNLDLYGTYYNWYTATAGRGTQALTNATAQGDICPTGWRLPISGTKDEYVALKNLRGVSGMYSYPANFTFSGRHSGSAVELRGQYGYLWYSYASTNNTAYLVFYNDANFYTASGSSNNKKQGNAVRCISKNATYTIKFNKNYSGASGTMSDVTAERDFYATLPANTFTSSATFEGWNTKADGTGTHYDNSASVTNLANAGSSITLYAEWLLYTLKYDANSGSGAPANQIGVPTSGQYAFTISSTEPTRSGYTFLGWSTNKNATTADYQAGDTYTATDRTSTLYAIWATQSSMLRINFNANGRTFDNGASLNSVYAKDTTQTVTVGTTPRYSHTSNISDAGVQDGDYPANTITTDVVTISGATKLHINLTYRTEATIFDWLTIWAGAHSDYDPEEDWNLGIKQEGLTTDGKIGGNEGGELRTAEIDIWGDSVTFGWLSDPGTYDYGYYAVVTAKDAAGNTLTTGQNSAHVRQIYDGEYKTPVIPSQDYFLGWSENQNATTATYTNNMNEILTMLPGSFGETKTLYAVWAPACTLTVSYGANVTGVTVNGTSVANNGTIKIPQGFTIPTTATFASGYMIDTWTATSGTVGLYKPNSTYTANSATATLTATAKSTTSTLLYDKVASMSKGTHGESPLFDWAHFTTPTSTNPATDTSKSGVFEWNNAKNDSQVGDSNGGNYPVYFYRGALDTTAPTIGAAGSANAYPNYVKINDKNGTARCWRIFRTTSTGGIKLIYSGTWANNTCAAKTTQGTGYDLGIQGTSTTVLMNMTSTTVNGKTYTGPNSENNLLAVSYYYPSSISATDTTLRTPAQLFGTNDNYATFNNTKSVLAAIIEDWYADNMTHYTDNLEGDAGFCNDRSMWAYDSATETYSLVADDYKQPAYIGSGSTSYTVTFGPSSRRVSNTSNPKASLLCPRGKVDIYSYSGDPGNGNGQLTYPAAVLTADEARLMVDLSTNSTSSSSYSAITQTYFLATPKKDTNSYYDMLTMSPGTRNVARWVSWGVLDGGYAYVGLNTTYSGSTGNLVRPVISLKHSAKIAGGNGTATNPWTISF